MLQPLQITLLIHYIKTKKTYKFNTNQIVDFLMDCTRCQKENVGKTKWQFIKY